MRIMQTALRSETTEVKIRTDGPFIVIGEKINPTGRKKLAEALQAGQPDELAPEDVAKLRRRYTHEYGQPV